MWTPSPHLGEGEEEQEEPTLPSRHRRWSSRALVQRREAGVGLQAGGHGFCLRPRPPRQRWPSLQPPQRQVPATSSAAALPAPPAPPAPLRDGRRERLLDFWRFVASALQGENSQDNICGVFELGGSIDCLGDVAFTRDEITAKFLRDEDLESVVWHCLLISWLGAGGPDQSTYKQLRELKLLRRYANTSRDNLHQIYDHVEQLAQEYGIRRVFHGDSTAVRFRLESSQGERLLHQWHAAVPTICKALREEICPKRFERVLRSTYYIGELTAKELFVHLHYAGPTCADTTRHVPIGDGARCGARLIVAGEAEREPLRQALRRGRGQPLLSAPGRPAPRARREDLEAVHLVSASRDDHMRCLPELEAACRHYQETAPHRHDRFRNCRINRPHLLDLADVEVMLCFYKNYCKLRARWGDGPVPPGICPRGWTRRGRNGQPAHGEAA
uniref:Uncharacterized protein n=1 Tax=Alexandrium monilatum TaxID=311494 RepID=A0A7S4RVF0_9DINO